MTQPENPIRNLIRLSIKDPRAAARSIISMQFQLRTMWEALALVVVLSGLTAHGSNLLASALVGDVDVMLPAIFYSPMLLTAIQGALLVMMALAVHLIGRVFGGRGELSEAVALVAWLQFMMVCLQVVQGVAMVLVPTISMLIGIGGVILFFYLLTQFVCELHGFDNTFMVLVGIIASMFGIIIGLSILLSFFGIGVSGDMPNV